MYTYTLILTAHERQAIDAIGARYAHGDIMSSLLWNDCQADDNEVQWDDAQQDITFRIPEHVAWGIQRIVEEDELECFSDSLREKIYDFCDQVV